MVSGVIWGDTDASEKRAPITVMTDDGCVYALLPRATPWEIPDLGILDRTMEALRHRFTSLGHRFWSSLLTVVASGGVVCIDRGDDIESLRHGVVGPRRQTRSDGLVQGWSVV